MEDILNKDIFDDKKLNKLSPDYNPSDIFLRMQVRRKMVKDTHNHAVLKNNNWQRKTIKRPKDCYKMNKEIAKLKNGFHNINLKNEIMLKDAIKREDLIKSKASLYGDNNLSMDDYQILRNDTDFCLRESLENIDDLVVANDSEFKINKPKETKVNTDVKKYKRNKVKSPPHDEVANPVTEDALRIECTYAYKTPRLKHGIKSQNNLNLQQEKDKLSPDPKDSNYQESTDVQINDLKKLLIMMTVGTKTNESEELDHQFDDVYEINSNGSIEFPVHSKDNDNTINFLNVIPMKIEINDRQQYLLKKYIDKWKRHVVRRKEFLNQQRQETLNNFFEKLEKKKCNVDQGNNEYTNKAKQQARDYSTYQHRYKVQKHIIALQKAKLEEQNRLIEELKYNKIVEASQQSVDAMREEVRKTYYEIDRHLKPKIKCLTNELKIQEIDEPSLVLHCLKVPQFLQRMEKRAREREEKHAMIRERRRQMEEERIRLKQQAELAKAEMDKEEKMKRMKELKEKRKKEKIENIRKKQHAERMRALIVMADLHYEKTLISKYGIRPLRLLMEIKRDNIEKARAHYKFQLKKNIFLNWMWYTEDMWFERNYKAEDFYRKKLLQRYFNGFKQNHHEFTLKKQVAEDYYDLYVTQLVFRKFKESMDIIKRENEIKWQKAVVYCNSNLVFRTFICWRTLPALNALKREQEARKARWREKVLQVVPDYTPPED